MGLSEFLTAVYSEVVTPVCYLDRPALSAGLPVWSAGVLQLPHTVPTHVYAEPIAPDVLHRKGSLIHVQARVERLFVCGLSVFFSWFRLMIMSMTPGQ